MISINYRDPRPIYLQIKENIIKLIMSGSLKQDEKIPSVRELAVDLAINPNTIQRAYRELENEGYIYVTAGKGSFVSPRTVIKADNEKLLTDFRDTSAKLIFNGLTAEELKAEIDKVYGEVDHND